MPETKYARSGNINIAYQVIGNGPLDLVVVMGWVSNLEYNWEELGLSKFLNRLAGFSRLIIFDKRGTGLSDRVSQLPTLEERMDDVRAVMDAAGSKRAAILGISEGGPMCALFAATYPERVISLVMYGTYAKRIWSPDYPWAPTPEERQTFLDAVKNNWGGIVDLETLAPGVMNDEKFKQWFATYLRLSASPRDALALAKMNTEIDVRNILHAIHTPTLVLHRTGDRDINIGGGRFIANEIPGAQFIELPGDDHLPWVGDIEKLVDQIEIFLTGRLAVHEPDRILATLLFTDIVGSTELATSMGDKQWHGVLKQHNDLIRKELTRYRGKEITTTGDGFLATFDGPGRGIHCAVAVRSELEKIGLTIRAGLHAGEIALMDNTIGGIAVHLCARVMSHAADGEILITSTVKDLVAGSGLKFETRDKHMLKGITGEWELFAVTG
jgi:pimeloyl-ACP methyl ester carboxylesterase